MLLLAVYRAPWRLCTPDAGRRIGRNFRLLCETQIFLTPGSIVAVIK
jgi:hypothetical protein